jgi:hypothetical protein
MCIRDHDGFTRKENDGGGTKDRGSEFPQTSEVVAEI